MWSPFWAILYCVLMHFYIDDVIIYCTLLCNRFGKRAEVTQDNFLPPYAYMVPRDDEYDQEVVLSDSKVSAFIQKPFHLCCCITIHIIWWARATLTPTIAHHNFLLSILCNILSRPRNVAHLKFANVFFLGFNIQSAHKSRHLWKQRQFKMIYWELGLQWNK